MQLIFPENKTAFFGSFLPIIKQGSPMKNEVFYNEIELVRQITVAIV